MSVMADATIPAPACAEGDEGIASTLYQYQNPLLIEDILDKIFPYFDDSPNLSSFRLVCTTWNKSAARTVKKNLRWKIGPALHSEKRFLDVMSKCADDIFENFLWTHNEKTPNMNSYGHGPRASVTVGLRRSSRRHHLGETWHEHVQEFLETFGSRIVNLELRARDPIYLERRLQSLYLHNLEHLELYDISEALMTAESFPEIKCFPKLRSICLSPKNFRDDDEMQHFNEGKAILCDRLLETALQVTDLEINLRKTNARILKEQQIGTTFAALTSLTTYRSSPPNAEESLALVALDRIEFQNLLKRCPNLKILCTTISHKVKQDDICEILSTSKVSNKLEELHLTIHEDLEFDDSAESSDNTDSSGSSGTSTDITTSEDEAHWSSSPERNLEPDFIAAQAVLAGVMLERENEQLAFAVKRRASSYPRQAPPLKMRNKHTIDEGKKRTHYPFPELPKLKRLGLHCWRLRNFDIFYNKPHLVKADLVLNDSSSLIRPFTSLFGENVSMKYLRCRDSYQDVLNEDGIEKLSELFPNLFELDVKLEDDYTLEAIFKQMPQLRRLNLNDSAITDEGITGMPLKQLKQAFEKWQTLEEINDTSAPDFRERSYIGCLKDLQQFTFTGHSLTKYSIHYGIAALKNLTNLKFAPYRVLPSYNRWAHNSSKFKEPVDIRPLLTHCKYLVKVDVNDDGACSDDEDSDFTDDSDIEEDKPTKPDEFKGCGLKYEQVQLVKESFPHLELVYAEKSAPS